MRSTHRWQSTWVAAPTGPKQKADPPVPGRLFHPSGRACNFPERGSAWPSNTFFCVLGSQEDLRMGFRRSVAAAAPTAAPLGQPRCAGAANATTYTVSNGTGLAIALAGAISGDTVVLNP